MVQYQLPVSRITGLVSRREGHARVNLRLGEGWTEVDHVDLIYVPRGDDYREPHYEILFYLVGHSEHEGFCVAQRQGIQEEDTQTSDDSHIKRPRFPDDQKRSRKTDSERKHRQEKEEKP